MLSLDFPMGVHSSVLEACVFHTIKKDFIYIIERNYMNNLVVMIARIKLALALTMVEFM